MEITRELAAISALNRMYGYSPVKGHALLEKYGSAAAVPGLSPEQEFAQLRWLRERGHILVSCLEEDYPPLLKETPDGPVGLYVTGVSPPREIFSYKRAIAIVGTRDITSYGAFWCRKIVQALAQTAERPVIVSGFAIGTDIIAQREALRCGLRTIGVMPCGPESIYPPRHRDTAGVLVNTEGCALVSDYPPGTGAVASNFIRRNRIIAGLADAVILIESKRRGGGLITMDFAADYGRAAYALPGRLEDPCSEGCNNLIRRNKAEIITDIDSLLDSLSLGLLGRLPGNDLLQEAGRIYADDPLPLKVLQHIKKHRGITPDEICADLNLPYSTVAQAVARLSGDGMIVSDPLQRCSVSR